MCNPGKTEESLSPKLAFGFFIAKPSSARCEAKRHPEMVRRAVGLVVVLRGTLPGALRCGMGRAANSNLQGLASQRADRADQARRALSVAIPVSAYICR